MKTVSTMVTWHPRLVEPWSTHTFRATDKKRISQSQGQFLSDCCVISICFKSITTDLILKLILFNFGVFGREW